MELNELIKIDKPEVLNVTVSITEVTPPDGNFDHPRVWFNQGQYFLNLKNIARYLVRKVDELTVVEMEILDPEQMDKIMAWFYGSVLTATLHLNDVFALHASAVVYNGKLNLFCGRSGIGKSTIATQLHLRGYPLFSDDKCVLFWNEEANCYYAKPAIQVVRLWEDATENIDIDDFLEKPVQVSNKDNKYQYQIKDEKGLKEAIPVDRIFLMKQEERFEEIEIKTPKGINKITSLLNQTHRIKYVRSLNKSKEHWSFIENVLKFVPLHIIHKPIGTKINDFVDFVESQLKNGTQ